MTALAILSVIGMLLPAAVGMLVWIVKRRREKRRDWGEESADTWR